MKSFYIFIFIGALQLCCCSKILFLIPMPSKSHLILGDRLIRSLTDRGHEVTLVSPFRMSDPPKTLTEVYIPEVINVFKELQDSIPGGTFSMRHMSSPLLFFFTSSLGEKILSVAMTSNEMEKFLSSNQKFDLVIGSCLLAEGLLAGFSYKYNAPSVGLTTFMPNTWANEMVGNPSPAAYIPEPMLQLTSHMNFIERVQNFCYGLLTKFFYYTCQLPGQDKTMRKHFGDNLPPLTEILANTSLLMANHHYSLGFPRPNLPNVIEVGGFHVKPPKSLPKDLQKFMDEAKDGVIYFSMGSNLLSSEFPTEKFQGIIKALGQLKQRVLWKFEVDEQPNLPANVKISKWMPQSDILAHPNLRLFITHGGLLSLTEAVLRGVPVVAIPIFGDQPMNVRYIVDYEIGVKLEFDDINEVNLLNAINTVLSDPKYAKNMKYRSTLLQDVPMTQLDTAIYWIEYVIRHKGAPHLRSAAQDLKWYQLYLLDVYAFLGAVLAGISYIFYLLLQCCKNCCSKKSTQTKLNIKRKQMSSGKRTKYE